MKFWVIMPAAGIGTRMQSQIPKQYLSIAGKKVIEHSLHPFLTHPDIAEIWVAISPHDTDWKTTKYANDKRVHTVEGGKERLFSVMNALTQLQNKADSEDWVLVHDAARPCLTQTDISQLIQQTCNNPAGGLLVAPLVDTIKQQINNGIKTIPRETLWRALTPQCFPIKTLYSVLEQAITKNLMVTDEASAMEQAGFNPQLVKGSSHNIKITEKADLILAEFFLHKKM